MCDQDDIITVAAEAIIKNEMGFVQRELNNLKEQLVFVKHTYDYMQKSLQALEENNLPSKNCISPNEFNNTHSYCKYNSFSKYIQFEKDDDISSDFERSSDDKDESIVEDVHQGKPKGIVSKMKLLSDKKKQKDRIYQISQPGDLFIERNMAFIKPTPSTSSFELSTSSDNEISNNYLHKKKRASKCNIDNENTVHIPIGFGNTIVSKEVYDGINWNSYTAATRKLLIAVFSRKVLATHSLTGKPSPAFSNKPAKLCLNPLHVADIVYEVTEKCNVKPNLVRIAITIKCADENKMMKMKLMKRNAI